MYKFYNFTAGDLWQFSVKQTLLHFARFCVLNFIKYNKYKYK